MSHVSNELSKLNVVFAADRNYIPHLATAVTSLLENNFELVQRVFVMTDAGGDRRFHNFLRDIENRYGFAPEVAEINGAELQGLYTSGHVSSASYNRFLLGDLLPQEISHALYLDCDLIVAGDLTPLLQLVQRIEMTASPIVFAAARDSGNHLVPFGHSGLPYFNAGVMLVNLRAWREQQVAKKLFGIARELYGKLHLWDQDVLNLVLESDWEPLPGEFNETQLKERSENARVVHFVGGTKPWMVGGDHPYRPDYDHYRKLTEFWPYLKGGALRHLRKRFIPRPLQKPKRTLRRLGKRVRRSLGHFPKRAKGL